MSDLGTTKRSVGARRELPVRTTRAAMRSAKGADLRAEYPYRMKDLCELTGLERQAIHFYIQEGLVPEGKKTGRNMAFYGPVHLDRIRLIKKLQRERFLPLRAIRAVLGGKEGGFLPEQRALLRDVKARLKSAPFADGDETISVQAVLAAFGLEARDVEDLEAAGLLSVEPATDGPRIRRDDAWLLEQYAELVRAGLTRDRGFSPRDLAIVDEAMSALFATERELLFERLGHLPPETIAAIVERVLPIMGTLLSRFHIEKARQTFALASE